VLGLGYAFQYPDLHGALREIFTRKPEPSKVHAQPAAAHAGSHH